MKDIVSLHTAEYETGPELIVSAPGRVALLGEHTEFCEGLVLAIAVDRNVQIAVSPRKDNSLRFFSANLNERKRTTLSNLKYKREDRWANFQKGVIYSLAELGVPIRGMSFTIASDIPQGVGFASSSAIEVATTIAVANLFGAVIPEPQLVEATQAAETRFLGKKAGPLSHIVAYAAKKNFALSVDLRNLAYKHVPFNIDPYVFLITDSRVPRGGVESELTARHNDCKRALQVISQRDPGLTLRDYRSVDLMDSMGSLPEIVRRRSLHVVEEIERVVDAESALNYGDFPAFGRIINHSHESLRDLYEVSCPEIDWLVKRALEIDGVLCSRMTGKGFGGCTITLVRQDVVGEYMKRLDEYERIFGFRPMVYETKASEGARILRRESASEYSSL